MWYLGVKYKKKYTPYSKPFETKKNAYLWYENYGKNLITLFNRHLELIEK